MTKEGKKVSGSISESKKTKEEKKASGSRSERKKRLREKIKLRNGLIEKSTLRTLLNAARIDRKLFQSRDLEDVVPAIGVSIGGYSRATGNDVIVTAYFSYGKRELKWDIVEGPLRHRLCVRWHDIGGLELKLNECGLACLSVHVKDTPTCWKYYPKTNGWSGTMDFTGDEIRKNFHNNLQTHLVLFEPGVVDKCYEKLLNYTKAIALVWEYKLQRLQEKLVQKSLAQFSINEQSSSSSREVLSTNEQSSTIFSGGGGAALPPPPAL